jgi:Low affinity iron permease
MPEPRKRHWTTYVGQAAGHPAAFVVVIIYAVLWLTFSRDSFDWNAVATLAVFVMTLFIQRANRRDNLALHAKLDELLRVDDDARSSCSSMNRNPKRSSGIATPKSARPAGDRPRPSRNIRNLAGTSAAAASQPGLFAPANGVTTLVTLR